MAGHGCHGHGVQVSSLGLRLAEQPESDSDSESPPHWQASNLNGPPAASIGPGPAGVGRQGRVRLGVRGTMLSNSELEETKAEVRRSFITTTVLEQRPRSHHKGATGLATNG